MRDRGRPFRSRYDKAHIQRALLGMKILTSLEEPMSIGSRGFCRILFVWANEKVRQVGAWSSTNIWACWCWRRYTVWLGRDARGVGRMALVIHTRNYSRDDGNRRRGRHDTSPFPHRLRLRLRPQQAQYVTWASSRRKSYKCT